MVGRLINQVELRLQRLMVLLRLRLRLLWWWHGAPFFMMKWDCVCQKMASNECSRCCGP